MMKFPTSMLGRNAAEFLSKDIESMFKSINSVWLDVDRAFEEFDRLFPVGVRNVTFPPADIVKTEAGYRVTLAVAGFSRNDLSVEVDGDNIITVAGKKEAKSEDTFLVKGIATRQFVRKWQLLAQDEVTGVKLEDGLLTIEIKRNEPATEEAPVTRFEIK